MAFLATVIIYCGDGPYWDNVRLFSGACRTNWWTNLLYINNLVRYDAHARVYNKIVFNFFCNCTDRALLTCSFCPRQVHEGDLVPGL